MLEVVVHLRLAGVAVRPALEDHDGDLPRHVRPPAVVLLRRGRYRHAHVHRHPIRHLPKNTSLLK